ncbi:MAG: glutamate--cysteine ligase [Acidimicrobiaceae bacterium]|nr:glutamate--cysteine ligase [Acidimicrobiaceae bacterium]
MATPTKELELVDACSLIGSCGFGPVGNEPRQHRTVGVELESFAVPQIPPERLPAVELPAGSRLTFEPGGQVELSSPPQGSVAAACDALSADLAATREAFSPLGVSLVQSGLRPASARPPSRLVDTPRYRAMEAYFDRHWSDDGRAMMRQTASVQVNLGLGAGGRASRRWRAANVLGPVLAAAFSSSPTDGGCGNARLATWLRLDPSRTAPVPCDPGVDPRRAWVDYALDAQVMLIRTDAGAGTDGAGHRCATEAGHEALVDEPITARTWIEHGHPLGWPSADDVAYHLTTLFPPVRPRGWLELRMIDALPDPWWRVPVAVAAALLDDADAVEACEPVADRWWEAAEEGMADPPLAAAAAVCARRALSGLHRVGVDIGTAVMVEQWVATVQKGCEPPWM